MEIVEILTHVDAITGPPTVNNCSEFTVNTAVAEVGVVVGNSIMYNAFADRYFTAGDQIKFMSIGYRMPMGFQLVESFLSGGSRYLAPIQVSLKATDKLTPAENVVFKWQHIPYENHEFETNIVEFIDPAIFSSGLFDLKVWFRNPYSPMDVNMNGVNVGHNMRVYHIPIFLKILHTIAMQP